MLLLVEAHLVLLVVIELLILLHCVLHACLPVFAVGRLGEHVVRLEHTDSALVQLDERVQLDLILSESDSFLEADS